MAHLHERGIEVVLSSGRSTVSMVQVARHLFGTDAPRYMISFNGAHLVDTLSDTLLYEDGLPQATIRELAEYGRSFHLDFQVFDEHRFIIERESDWSRAYAVITSMECLIVSDVAEARPGGSPKFLFTGNHDTLVEHEATLMERAQNRYRVTFSKPHLLEILPAEASKGAALLHLANHLDIPLSAVVAAGDGPNDIEMIQTAGVGVAVANAHPSLKSVADYVTKRNAGDGAAEEIVNRYFTNGESHD